MHAVGTPDFVHTRACFLKDEGASRSPQITRCVFICFFCFFAEKGPRSQPVRVYRDAGLLGRKATRRRGFFITSRRELRAARNPTSFAPVNRRRTRHVSEKFCSTNDVLQLQSRDIYTSKVCTCNLCLRAFIRMSGPGPGLFPIYLVSFICLPRSTVDLEPTVAVAAQALQREEGLGFIYWSVDGAKAPLPSVTIVPVVLEPSHQPSC